MKKTSNIFLVAVLIATIAALIGTPILTEGKDLIIPFSVLNNAGVDRGIIPVRGSLPVPEGLLMPAEISELAVVDANGVEWPAQFDPFVRWWGKDGSVKWLLVDLLADVKPNAEQRYWVTQKKTVSSSLLSVTEDPNLVTVTTGPLKATISKKKGTILESVHLDSNSDGVFSTNERLIKPDASNGSVILSDDQEQVFGECNLYNMWGTGNGRITDYQHAGWLKQHPYGSGFGAPDKVAIEAKGPVRATIRIEGKHWPQSTGDGIRPEGFYYYTIWLHFYAGQSFIGVEHSLENNRTDFPMHMYRIKGLKLRLALDSFSDKPGWITFGGEKQHTVTELSAHFTELLQDSSNLERWDLHEKLKGKKEEEQKKLPGYFFQASWKIGPALFRGYKVQKYLPEQKAWQSVGEGDHAPGWIDVASETCGVSAFVNRFWEECPKGMRANNAGIEVSFLPEFSPEQFQIHSSARKSHTVTLNFHSKRLSPELLENQNKQFQYPLVMRPDRERLAVSKAWPRLTGVTTEDLTSKPKSEHWYPHFEWDKKIITARWHTAGIEAGFNQGGMHSNYWSLFNGFLNSGRRHDWEEGVVKAKWASERIPWLIHDYNLSPGNTEPQNQLIAYGPKKLYTYREAGQIRGWVNPYITNIPAFSSPDKFHLDGEHLIHMWPFEWYYLTGSPIARDGLMAVGNMAKYSVHRNFFKNPKNSSKLNPAPSLDETFFFDDEKYPERKPWYFYTRIYSSHLLSTAWTYAATGDPNSLFYAKWLVRRILYLQKQNGGILWEEMKSIPPWQEAENAIAAFELYREIGDKELLDIMGSWLEWVSQEAYLPGKGMPHRLDRGATPEAYEYHWYPGVAAPACYIALGDKRALDMTREWAESSLANINKGKFLEHPAGQTAAYVLTVLEKGKTDQIPPEPITDLKTSVIEKDAITLTWTAPKDSGSGSDGSANKYWIKYSDKPIVNHPKYPEEFGKKVGFYQADNVRGEPVPIRPGKAETFQLSQLAPHETYGSTKPFGIQNLKEGTYYFVIKSWDKEGNLSPLSNVAEVRIQRSLSEKIKRLVK